MMNSYEVGLFVLLTLYWTSATIARSQAILDEWEAMEGEEEAR